MFQVSLADVVVQRPVLEEWQSRVNALMCKHPQSTHRVEASVLESGELVITLKQDEKSLMTLFVSREMWHYVDMMVN